MTVDDLVTFLRVEFAVAGVPFKVTADPKLKREGLLVRKYGRDFKLSFLSEDGIPKRIPLALRDLISRVTPKLFPGVTTPPAPPGSLEYGRSSETLRRAQTMRSILRSALESTAQKNAERIKNLKIEPTAITELTERAASGSGVSTRYAPMPVDVAKIRDRLLRDAVRIEMVECLDAGQSGFPRRPTLVDLATISVSDPKGIPKTVTFVRMHPPPPTRTFILSEAPVGNAGQRADAVSLSYKLSEKEIAHVNAGTIFDNIPATERIALDPYLHIGDTNRHLMGGASDAHAGKTINYAGLALKDAIDQSKTYKLTLRGRFVVTITDSRQFSPGLVLDAETGALRPSRESEDFTAPGSKRQTPPQPGAPEGVLKSVCIVLEAEIVNGTVTTLKKDTAAVVFVRDRVPPEIMTLEKLQKVMPHEVPTALAALTKAAATIR